MKKSFFLFTLLIFVCNDVFAQDLKKHHEFDSKYWDDYITTYKPFIQFSPDSNYFIDLICSSIAIEKREGKFYGSADADQGITLGNIKKKSTFLLAFTGPSGSFTEAKWFNNEIVIIIGYFDDSKKDVTKAGYKSKLFDKIIFE